MFEIFGKNYNLCYWFQNEIFVFYVLFDSNMVDKYFMYPI